MSGAGVSTIVLAAGASSRLGSPKAMVNLGGRSALRRVLDSLAEAGVTSGAVVVASPHEDRLRAEVDPSPLAWVTNPHPEAGRTGSLQSGWSVVPAGNVVLLWPVDRPLARAGTVSALLSADRPDADFWVLRPRTPAGSGHPVLLSPSLRGRVMAAAPDENLRRILSADGVRRFEVDVDDEGIHANLDTAADVRAAGGEPG